MPRARQGNGRPPTPRSLRGGKRGQRNPPDDGDFGWDPTGDPPIETVDGIPVVTIQGTFNEQASEPAPELVALGLPPSDAAGIQKWHYQALSTMAALVLRSNTISDEQRMKRFGALTNAAARHYPEAAKYDLAQQIARDAAEVLGRKRAKAAAKLEKAPVEGGAKVIPIRRDAEVS